MIITCEACGTSYRLKTSLLKKTGSTVRCSKCHHMFIAYPPSSESQEPFKFMPEERLETSIDRAFEGEPAEELSDLEAEIDAHASDLSGEVSGAGELFEETEVSFEVLGADVREPEIMIEDLEADESEIISLEGLTAESEAAAEIDFDEIAAEPVEETEETISLADIEMEAEEETVGEIAIDDLEGEAESTDETGVLADAEMEAEIEEEILEEAEPQEAAADVEAEGFEFETEGGVVDELEDFDLEKEPKKGDLSGKAKKETAKTQPEKTAQKPEKEEDFELDFESELSEADFEKEAAPKDEAGLDLDGFVEMDLEEEPEKEPSAKTEEEDFDLDLEAEELDFKTEDFELDLGSETVEVGTEDFDLDLGGKTAETGEEGLDLDLGPETAEVGTEDFDLDLEGETTEAGELDLDWAPKTAEAGTEDFELDLEEEPTEELTTAESEETVEAVTGKVKTEELDLSDIEDFLDFEEAPETVTPEAESEEAAEETLGLDLDFETVTAPEEDIDLETIMEEAEAGEEKEVALETFGEREKRIEAEYKKTAGLAMEEVPQEAPEEVVETFEAARAVPEIPSVFVKEEKRLLKPLLIALVILIALGVLIFAVKYFGAKRQAPVPDQGNLQIEMIANPAYKFVVNEKAGELLLVTGDVTNRYDDLRSEIQVKGTLYNHAGKAVGVSTAYCGNMLTDSDLTSLELETIKTHLLDRKGDKEAGFEVNPGQKLPFTVVFSPVPEGAEAFDVAVVASSKG